MTGEQSEWKISGRWHRSRALSTVTAAIIMIVVVVVVGAAAYVAISSTNKNGTTSTSTYTGNPTCQPANSNYCLGHQSHGFTGSVHDLSVLAAFKSVQTGNPVPFTAILPSGQTATSYTFSFGDGSSQTTTSPTVDHTYTSPGEYLIQLDATIGGTVHDNLASIPAIGVTANYVLQNGKSVTLTGSYLGAPTNPAFTPNPPTLVSSSAALSASGASSTATSVTSTYSSTTAGTYLVTLVGEATGSAGTPFAGQHAYQNYSWTVVVAPSGTNGALAGTLVPPDPHPGTFIYYNGGTGGAQSLDPAIAYDTLSYEPILEVYEGLIMYNGSLTGPDPSNYLPVLSTCVPGPNSASCNALYHTTLYNQANETYTFPIDKAAKFYDPNTGASWPVFPSDVVFSLARTMSFATQPAAGSHNGWIITQSLLPGTSSATNPANQAWDGGIHWPYNNTPQNIMAAMSVNDSTCTSAILADSNGCVTFHVNGNDQVWPYFLELVADQLGASIMSCGWTSSTTAHGGGQPFPGWNADNGGSDVGDHPCAMPSASTIASWGPTSWDGYQSNGAGSSPPGNVHQAMVGTGPFYLYNYQAGASYTLKASPAYAPNEFCTWTNCMPPVGHTIKTMEEIWETDPTQGEQAIASGVADTAAIPATDTALALQLIQQGKINALTFPSISIFFYPFNLAFDKVGAAKFTTNPITVNSDWFTNVGMRNFFATAYPYTTIQQTVLTQDGIQGGFNYGGAIPQFMANYYPANISWPSQDPSAACAANANGPLCPTYWWNQITNPSSQYYDAEAAACTTSNPCQLPLIGETGAGEPILDEQNSLWIKELTQFSGGKLKVTFTDINFVQLVVNSLFSAPYGNPMPVYTLGWAPDYPDPTDYVAPLYYPDSTYTYSDTVQEQLAGLNSSSCSTDLAYYAGSGAVNESCQGAAYTAMTHALLKAATMPAGPARVYEYNQAESIANKLALYVYQYQQDVGFNFAPWVSLSSVNTNVTTGGGQDLIFWGLTGNGLWG
jgi:peptide/nickel transport system substrate-binding protein